MSLLLTALQAGHRLSLRNEAQRLQAAFARPRTTQESRLIRLVSQNLGTAYGEKYSFERIRNVQDYQRRVPVMDYDALSPWINRIANGEQRVLTQARVRMLEPSGGSTSTNKFIPYTAELLADFSRATNPWLFDLYNNTPGLAGTRSYWSISLAKQGERSTPGGVPIGFDDDTEYFSPTMRWALTQMMAVPNAVARAPDMDSWRQQTAHHMLMAGNLGLISVWSPTFLTLLMDYIAAHLDELLRGLPAQRASNIRQGLERQGRLCGEALWPQLKIISCWTDSIAASFLPELKRWFPHTPIQGKGLLATEGVVSAPLLPTRSTTGQLELDDRLGCPLAITSHFLEFIDLQQPNRTPCLAHELRVGGSYSPILSTSGGLYRYHLKDVVDCVGMEQDTPRIRFAGKLDRVSDLCGEKVHANQVEQALQRVRQTLGAELRFALLAPVQGSPSHYRLYL